MEEKKEMSLIEKRAKLIEFQNQISWIASEYAKISKIKSDTSYYTEDNFSIILSENLVSIIRQINALSLEELLSDEYKSVCNDLLCRMQCKAKTLVDRRIDEIL